MTNVAIRLRLTALMDSVLPCLTLRLFQGATGVPSRSASNRAPVRATTASVWNLRLGPAAPRLATGQCKELCVDVEAWHCSTRCGRIEAQNYNTGHTAPCWLPNKACLSPRCHSGGLSAACVPVHPALASHHCRQGVRRCSATQSPPCSVIWRPAALLSFPTRALASRKARASMGPEGGTPMCHSPTRPGQSCTVVLMPGLMTSSP